MARLKNINPLGGVDLPLINRSLAADEEFEVTDEQAAILLLQVDNYQAVSTAPSTPAAPAAPAPTTTDTAAAPASTDTPKG